MTTLAEDRREEFKKNIAEMKLDKKQAGGDAATRSRQCPAAPSGNRTTLPP